MFFNPTPQKNKLLIILSFLYNTDQKVCQTRLKDSVQIGEEKIVNSKIEKKI